LSQKHLRSNFRKTHDGAYGTLGCHHDFQLRQRWEPTAVTDPLSHTTTTAYTEIEDNGHRSIWPGRSRDYNLNYDGASNVTSIVRPDNTTENKTYVLEPGAD
jgi:hypothetical protein